jgi:hypothetical protein
MRVTLAIPAFILFCGLALLSVGCQTQEPDRTIQPQDQYARDPT